MVKYLIYPIIKCSLDQVPQGVESLRKKAFATPTAPPLNPLVFEYQASDRNQREKRLCEDITSKKLREINFTRDALGLAEGSSYKWTCENDIATFQLTCLRMRVIKNWKFGNSGTSRKTCFSEKAKNDY